MTTPIAVLLSGRGSNFVALHDAIAAGEVPAHIALVASNIEAAPGLELARARGLRVESIPHRDEPSREAHEARVLASIRAAGAEWICLAGYMRLLSAKFVRSFPARILNIHPSLLPAFPGVHAQRQALEAGARVSGCTVHLVDEGLDSGPIVHQVAVEIQDDDTEESLAARILEQEHRAYPHALRRLLTEEWTLRGRRIVFRSSVTPGG